MRRQFSFCLIIFILVFLKEKREGRGKEISFFFLFCSDQFVSFCPNSDLKTRAPETINPVSSEICCVNQVLFFQLTRKMKGKKKHKKNDQKSGGSAQINVPPI